MSNLRLAHYPEFAGRSRVVTVDGAKYSLVFVAYGEQADITYQKFTRNYSRYNARPYVTGRSAYATAEAAVRAIVKARAEDKQ